VRRGETLKQVKLDERLMRRRGYSDEMVRPHYGSDEAIGPFIGRVATSLELRQAVYKDPGQPLSMRPRAALGAIPFEHPRLTLTAQLNGTADRIETELKARLERNGVKSGDDPGAA
jgi:hypothetical protein